jgi:predicted metal-dependent hydrolase
MSPTHDSVAYGKETLRYTIHRADRKTLEIAVHPDGSLVVRAPRDVAPEEIRKRILKRAGWIRKQRNYFLPLVDQPRVSRLCLHGATQYYLGRPYRLRISQDEKTSVSRSRNFIHVMLKGRWSLRPAQSALDAWYREQAKFLFTEILEKNWPRFEKFLPAPPRLQVRALKKRWGSLSPKRTLTLNLDLIRTPKECIEYVVVHELCHLAHHDHGKGFYRLLGKVMPDWAKRKRKLETGPY